MLYDKKTAITAIGVSAITAFSTSALAVESQSKIKDVSIADSGNTISVKFVSDTALPAPNKFTIQNPNREVIDFPGVENGSGKRAFPFASDQTKGIQLVQGEGRMRVVISNPDKMEYSISNEGGVVTLNFTKKAGAEVDDRFRNIQQTAKLLDEKAEVSKVKTEKAAGSLFVKPETQVAGDFSVKDYEFRRTADGGGELAIDLSDVKMPFDLKNKEGKVTLTFKGASIPFNLEKKLKVGEYNTPVSSIEGGRNANGAFIVLTQKNAAGYEAVSYINNGKLIISVKNVKEELLGDAKRVYKGDKMSVKFQSVDVRAVLSTIAEFTGLNITTSPTVQGNITLQLNGVPWDQILDIVLDSSGLGMVRKGNVIQIATKQEIADRERAEANLNEQRLDREPLATESFQLSFQRADNIRQLLVDKDQRILSKRGSVMIDTRTNMVFVNDVSQKLEEARALIKKVDIPIRQVMIEARIVEASENFAKNIGARLGINSLKGTGLNGNNSNNLVNLGGNLNSNMVNTGQLTTTPTISDTMGVNLPAASVNGFNASAFSFILFNKAGTRFLNMELSALVSDGKGKIVSSPRVVTADQVEASIEQGTEIPYQQATSAGATSIAFKKAVLSLKVKPQITPDNRVVLDLNVTKDSVGTVTTSGPAIDTKRITTQVLVENGGTVAIGGIITQDESDTTVKTPLLGDIPFVGMLFKNNSKISNRKELIMLITPKVVQDLSIER